MTFDFKLFIRWQLLEQVTPNSTMTIQKIPVSLQVTWFFSSPANLQKITPANRGFEIISLLLVNRKS
jgi:hypothetical protein